MSHVVDKVILHFSELLLPECHNDSEYKNYHHYHRECESRQHEGYRLVDIVLFGWENDFQVVVSESRIMRKEDLGEHIVLIGNRWMKILGSVYWRSCTVYDLVFEWHVQAQCVKLFAQILPYDSRVGSLYERTPARLAYKVYYHIVDEAFLMKILLLPCLLRCLVVVYYRSI